MDLLAPVELPTMFMRNLSAIGRKTTFFGVRWTPRPLIEWPMNQRARDV